MRKFWKIFLGVLLGLIVLITGAVHVSLYTQVRNKIIHKITPSFMNGEVNVGSLDLRLLPNIKLELGDISLTYPTVQDTVINIGLLRAGVNIRPWLRDKCIDAPDLLLSGLYANIQACDTLIFKASEEPEEEETGPVVLPAMNVGFALEDTHLYFLDLVKDASLKFKLAAQNSVEGVLDADLTDLCLKLLGLDFDAEIHGRDILGDDPHVSVDADALAALNAFRKFFPSGVSADGDISLGVNGVLAKSGANAVAEVKSGSLKAELPFGRIFADNVRIVAGASEGASNLPPRPARRGEELPDFLSEEDFRAADIDIQLDTAVTSILRQWNPRGEIHLGRTLVSTPYMPTRNEITGFDARFDTGSVAIDKMSLRTGISDLSVTGILSGLQGMLTGRGKGLYDLKLDIKSQRLDINTILATLERGMRNASPSDSVVVALSDEEYQEQFSGTVNASDEVPDVAIPLIVVPANLRADVSLNAKRVKYSDLDASNVTAHILAAERTILVRDLGARTPAGAVAADAFYSTRTKKDISAGFDLNLENITADKVIQLIPAVDTLVPLLKNFKGNLNCEIAATTKLDTLMNVQTPTFNGAFKVTGSDVSLVLDDDMRKIARLLLFRNKKKSKIDSLYISGVIGDDQVRLFPFSFKVDRYQFVVSGRQRIDGMFDYKASLLHSPFLLKFGVQLNGRDYDNMKFKFIKPQYRSGHVPEFHTEVEEMLLNQKTAIRSVIKTGSSGALAKSGSVNEKALKGRQEDIRKMDEVEELSPEETAKLDSLLHAFDREELHLDEPVEIVEPVEITAE